MRKSADMNDFMGAQLFFDSMTRNAMNEYAMTGEVETNTFVLTDSFENNGAKKVVSFNIGNPFDSDGVNFLISIIGHAAKKMLELQKIKAAGLEVIATHEMFLQKAKGDDENDTILAVYSYRGVSIKRTFVTIKNNMSFENKGVRYDLMFEEIEDD